MYAVPDRTVMQLWSRSLTGPSLTADCRCFQSACVQTHRERTDKSNGDFNGANDTNAKGRERLVSVYIVSHDHETEKFTLHLACRLKMYTAY